MIRMIQSRNASHAKAYFRDALAQADYYISGQELAGCWQGRLAERLGLAGESGKEEFSALCENRHPTTGARLTPRQKKDRTVGYDINFHCPKSLSILHAFSQDDHLLTAFRASVRETMQMIEADSRTAVRVSGRAEERKTGELAWAEFIHQTARPVEGHMPDPHLHAHCFVFNATWDPVEERIKAGQFREINRDMPYYQACFQKTLADKLAELGYQIRRTETSFEIAGVPERVIDLFSKRTDEIGRTATAQGITDAKARSELGARTRAKKQKGASMAELTRDWRQQIDALGPASETEAQAIIRFAPPKAPAIDPPEVATRPDAGDRRQGGAAQIPGFGPGREATTAPTLVQDASGLTARHCVDYALLHCFERASVIDGRRLLETALHRSLGASSVPALEIHRAFQADPRVLHVQEKGRTLCTTKEVLAEERRRLLERLRAE